MAWIAAIVGLVGSYAASESASSAAGKAGKGEAALRGRELALAESQDARAGVLFDEYQQTYLPRERQVVNDAFNDENSPEAAAARATTDVRSASAQRQQTGLRDARALGINPTSGAFASMETERGLKDAALEVSARDTARRGARDTNFQRQYSVLSLGKGMPSTAGALTNSAMQGVGGLADAAAARTNSLNRLAGEAGAELGSSAGALAQAGVDAWRANKKKNEQNQVAA